MFETLLTQAKQGPVGPELALALLEGSARPEHALLLFQAASELRDRHLGRTLWWTGAIEGILPCRLAPMCSYCTYRNGPPFSRAMLLEAVRALEGLGFRHLHLSGGTRLEGYDEEVLAMVRAIREVSDVRIEVNVGPSLSLPTVRALKALGISSITSSLETIRPELFRDAKPGDTLDGRKALLTMADAEGIATRAMMLLGLGETLADRIQFLFFFKQLKHAHQLRFSRLQPFPGTPYGNKPRCSPWELARTVAVARLVHPALELGLAAGNSLDDIPLWWLAGGGNQLLGAAVTRSGKPGATELAEGLCLTSRMADQARYTGEMGLAIGFAPPPAR